MSNSDNDEGLSDGNSSDASTTSRAKKHPQHQYSISNSSQVLLANSQNSQISNPSGRALKPIGNSKQRVVITRPHLTQTPQFDELLRQATQTNALLMQIIENQTAGNHKITQLAENQAETTQKITQIEENVKTVIEGQETSRRVGTPTFLPFKSHEDIDNYGEMDDDAGLHFRQWIKRYRIEGNISKNLLHMLQSNRIMTDDLLVKYVWIEENREDKKVFLGTRIEHDLYQVMEELFPDETTDQVFATAVQSALKAAVSRVNNRKKKQLDGTVAKKKAPKRKLPEDYHKKPWNNSKKRQGDDAVLQSSEGSGQSSKGTPAIHESENSNNKL